MKTHDVDGYSLGARVHAGAGCVVYRATRDADGLAVIVKVPLRGANDPRRLAELRREGELGAELEHPRLVPTIDTPRCGHSIAIVMPDFGGTALRKILPESGLDAAAFFELAIPLTEAVAALHEAEVIHKDINPNNIVVNPATNELRVIDFSIASRLPRESQSVVDARLLQGTLRYIAPEQTGRLNRSVTRRADLYALGATFYEMLTGRPPFDLDSDLELVHHHLAVVPDPPSKHRRSIAPGLDALVLKLLAKSPAERHKSAVGVLRDLTRMQAEFRQYGEVRSTEVAVDDVALRFEVPEALYGREAQLAELTASFAQACAGKAQTVFVQGPAGIGKSVLIAELHRPVSAARGHLVAGKFDQLRRSEPYSAISAALDAWLGHILAGESSTLDETRQRLAEALGDNAALLTGVVPRLGRLFPEAPAVPELEGGAAEARFAQAFLAFLGAASSKRQPLVLFLDDLQWADAASVNLLHAISRSAADQHLLTIAAFRDGEIGTGHPVARLQRELAKQGVSPRVLELGPLDDTDVRQLVADALHVWPDRVTGLASIVVERTGGNPFFVAQFLEALYRDQLIRIDARTGVAKWDEAAIRARDYTSNVVELMISAIEELSGPAQRVLQTAACIGNQFSGELLAQTLDFDSTTLRRGLDEALVRGLALPLDGPTGDRYRFLHDRVQEAAYEMLDADARVATHTRIGTLLRQSAQPADPSSGRRRGHDTDADLQDAVFEVVRHLNAARHASSTPEHDLDLARLNLQAAQRARASAAFDVASRYCQQSVALLGDDAWQQSYPLALAVHALGAEAALLSGDFETWDRMAALVETHARTELDRVPIAELRIRHLNGDNLLAEAVELALDTLTRLGVDLPRSDAKLPVIRGVIGVKWAIRGRPPTAFHELPAMRDPIALAAMRVLSSATTSAYHARPSVLPHIVFAMMRLSLRHGNAPHSPNGFMGYALALNGPMNDPSGAYAYGKFALDLSDRIDAKALRARVIVPYNIFIRHWNEPLQSTLDPLAQVFHLGLEVGDIEYAVLGPQMRALHQLMLGAPLKLMLAELDAHAGQLGRFQQRRGEIMVGLYRAFGYGFCAHRADPSQLEAEGFELAQVLPEIEATENHTALAGIRVARLMLRTHFGQHQAAVADWPETEAELEALAGTVWLWAAWFHAALSAAIVEREATPTAQTRYLIKRGLSQLEAWAARCPQNFGHKVALVRAELARRDDDHDQASLQFTSAVDGAAQHGFVADLALACERAADHYAALGQHTLASMYAGQALSACAQWDAEAKAAWLVRSAPELYASRRADEIGPRPPGSLHAKLDSWGAAGGRDSEDLDLQSVLKGAQAISGQIDVQQLTRTLLEVVIESAGARRGVLVLGADAEARVVGARGPDLVEAEASFEVHPLDQSDLLPAAIARYVLNTHERVALEDAKAAGPFAGDADVQRLGLRSVICVPLRRPDQVLGALYLDNNLVAGAFPAERIEVLELLASQIAISLQNATLYAAQADALRETTALHEASSRFVPHQFIRSLERESLLDVSVGDCVQREMSVMFSDMRNFTTLIESLTPDQSIAFINEYLSFVEPAILGNSGFIDTYLGDGVMALFDTTADNALRAAITMQRRLRSFSAARISNGLLPVHTGIGINTGEVMLGTIGGKHSMKCGVIGDAVNLAARIEPMTKRYGALVLISGHTQARLQEPRAFRFREIDEILVKGKTTPTRLIESLDALDDETRRARERTRARLSEAREAFKAGKLEAARKAFVDCATMDPSDRVPRVFLERCEQLAREGLPPNWQGVTRFVAS